MQQRLEDQQPHTTIEEVEQRLFAMGAMRGKDDPMVKRMIGKYDKPLSDEEMYEMMDKVLGNKSILDALNEIR